MDEQVRAPKPRWGQARRLAFIDVRLQYDGRINRGDLITYFDISMPQASADLGLYQSIAHENMAYDASARVYVAQPGFKAQYKRSSASRYLDDIYRVASGIVEPDESFVGFLPPTGIVATPARAFAAAEVATLVQAIRDGVALNARYQSMELPNPQSLVLSPHALGFDGLRWHARAWCHERKLFRDFAVGRLQVDGRAVGAQKINPESDIGWNTHVPIVLVPHSKLSPDQRETVMKDYDMKSGELVLECRKAMLFYTLRHLNIEDLKEFESPTRQHVVVKNAADVARWIEEDREGR